MHFESGGAGFHLSSWRLPSERMEHSRLHHRRYWVSPSPLPYRPVSTHLPRFSLVSTILSRMNIQGFDVKALRAFRVLRPLRLVSGVPSELDRDSDPYRPSAFPHPLPFRLTSRAERYPSGNDTSAAHCVASPICNFDLCYYRVRAILWEVALHVVRPLSSQVFIATTQKTCLQRGSSNRTTSTKRSHTLWYCGVSLPLHTIGCSIGYGSAVGVLVEYVVGWYV